VSRFASRTVTAFLLALVACRPPRVVPLEGSPAPAQALPHGVLPGGHRKLVFTWEMQDVETRTRGDGVARIASPDSVRLDFFLGGGVGSGAAVMIGDSLQVPGPDAARRLIPPRALLWAALGRLDIPAERDTVVRVDAGLLRADIGSPTRWRATFRGDTLTRLERVEGGRLQEWVERRSDGAVRYRHESARRTLLLVIQRSDAVPPFDPAIWSL
jgi:hypothetical protein